MKTSSWLLLGGGAFLLWKFGGLARAAGVLQFVFKSFSFTGISTLNIVLTVQNVSNATIRLNSLAGTVTLNGSNLGNISNFTGIDILPNSQTDIVLTLSLSMFSLPSELVSFFNNPTQNYNMVITGNVNVNSIIVPFNISNELAFAI